MSLFQRFYHTDTNNVFSRNCQVNLKMNIILKIRKVKFHNYLTITIELWCSSTLANPKSLLTISIISKILFTWLLVSIVFTQIIRPSGPHSSTFVTEFSSLQPWKFIFIITHLKRKVDEGFKCIIRTYYITQPLHAPKTEFSHLTTNQIVRYS